MKNKHIFVFSLGVLIVQAFGCVFGKSLNMSEVITAGYYGVIYGNQDTGGISIYELGTKSVRNIIKGDPGIEYAYPQSIGDNFVCIRKRLLSDKYVSDVIESDLHGKVTPLEIPGSANIYSIGVSSRRINIAVVSSSDDGLVALDVYDIMLKKHIVGVSLGDMKNKDSLKAVWGSNDDMVYVVDQSKSGKLVTLSIGKVQDAAEFPVCCNSHSCISIHDGKYFVGANGDIANKTISINKNTIHALSLTQKGDFFIYGWLRGTGFETISINEIKTGRKFDIKLDHPGTVLGLQLI